MGRCLSLLCADSKSRFLFRLARLSAHHSNPLAFLENTHLEKSERKLTISPIVYWLRTVTQKVSHCDPDMLRRDFCDSGSQYDRPGLKMTLPPYRTAYGSCHR
jgi:hypothetical protein